MALRTFITNYSHFNYWANKEIVSWLREVEVGLITENVKSSYTSIDFTLQHILRTQKFWMAFVSRQSLGGFKWAVEQGSPLETFSEIIEQSGEMRTTCSSFSELELEEMLELDMPWAKNNRCRYDYIIHAVNHSTFHRGQIVTIARLLGITENIPSTDYNIFNSKGFEH